MKIKLRTSRPVVTGAMMIWAGLMAGAAQAATVDVLVGGVRNTRGHVHVEVCPEALFLKDCSLIGRAPARVGSVWVRVRNVPAGDYAVQAYHDENDNEKVDRGLFGIPKEGIAFSNDAPLHRSGPRFDEARFHVSEPETHIEIKLRHLP